MWNVEPTYDISVSEPLVSLSDFDGPVHDIDFHPSAGNLLAVGSKKSYTIADVETGTARYNRASVTHSANWRSLASSASFMCLSSRCVVRWRHFPVLKNKDQDPNQ